MRNCMMLAFCVVFVAAGAVNASLYNGLVGYYSFDDGTVSDSSRYGNDGVVVGSDVTLEIGDGVLGPCMRFLGAGRIQVEDTATLQKTGAGAIQVWFKTQDDSQRGVLITKANWTENVFPYHVETLDNEISLFFQNNWSDKGLGITDLADSGWNQLVVSMEGETATIYYNGQFKATKNGSNGIFNPDSGADLSIGGWMAWGNPDGLARLYNGLLDEVGVWDRALSAAEVAALYNNGRGYSPVQYVYEIYPQDGERNVKVDNQYLQWETTSQASGVTYSVYCAAGDANDLNASAPIAVGLSDKTCNLTTPLAYDTLYSWRVDAYEPNLAGGSDVLYPGEVYTFKTRAAAPLINAEPQDVVGGTGQTVHIVVDVSSDSPMTITWFKVVASGTDVEVTDEDPGTPKTLDLTITGMADEGDYYCTITNPSLTTSQTAYLTVKQLVARWEFEDALSDIAGNGWDGQINTGEPNYVEEGKNGKAIRFIGSAGRFVHIPGSAQGFGFIARGYTIGGWTQSTQSGWGAYLSKATRDSSSAYDGYKGFNLVHSGGSSVHQIRNWGDVWTSSPAVNNGQWHHVVASYNAQTHVGRIFVDGVLRSSGQNISYVDPATSERTNQPFVMGVEATIDPALAIIGSTVPYDGLLDDIRVYNYAMSQDEIADWYGSPVCPAGNPKYDLTNDCRVNIDDFAVFAGAWMDCNIYPECVPVIGE